MTTPEGTRNMHGPLLAPAAGRSRAGHCDGSFGTWQRPPVPPSSIAQGSPSAAGSLTTVPERIEPAGCPGAAAFRGRGKGSLSAAAWRPGPLAPRRPMMCPLGPSMRRKLVTPRRRLAGGKASGGRTRSRPGGGPKSAQPAASNTLALDASSAQLRRGDARPPEAVPRRRGATASKPQGDQMRDANEKACRRMPRNCIFCRRACGEGGCSSSSVRAASQSDMVGNRKHKNDGLTLSEPCSAKLWWICATCMLACLP